MLSPKRTKFRKGHKGRIHGAAKGGTELNFGAYGLKAMEPARVTARQIEAARRAITRHMKCRSSWRTRRSRWRPPSCRSRRASSAVWAKNRAQGELRWVRKNCA
jgi:ribosomal protein L16